MKTRMLVSILILVLAVMIIAGSCATTKKAISEEDAMKVFEGVYVNTEYSGQSYTPPQKVVITADRRFEDWALATNEYPSWKAEYKVAESWIDSKGNTYCTVDMRYSHGDRTKELWKLDKSGKILEVNFQITVRGEYPKIIDSNPDPTIIPTLHYCIWYRQE
jgi:hypothetical protein